MNKQEIFKDRVLTLYSMLTGIPEPKLDLSVWRSTKVRTGLMKITSNHVLDETLMAEYSKCGTQACAIGWACAYPPFKEQGLSFNDGEPVFNRNHPGFPERKDDLVTAFVAIEKFFGIEDDFGRSIFMPADLRRDFVDGDVTVASYEMWTTANGRRVKLRDKLQVLMKLRNYIYLQDWITRERYEDLKQRERTNNFEWASKP